MDGTGSGALFDEPYALAVDAASNVYVADTYGQTIRKVTPAGVVTTLAGSPFAYGTNDGIGSAARFWNPSGIAVDAMGNIYVADTVSDIVREVTLVGSSWVVKTLAGQGSVDGTRDGTGSGALFSSPTGTGVGSTGEHLCFAAIQGDGAGNDAGERELAGHDS